jgi:TolB-like protein/DNA-binding winged helix-turn-helix (wHTH) protein
MASSSIGSLEPVRFGDNLELDPHTYELRRSGRPVKLERIPMELLLYLVEQRGQVVTRDQIVERIWGKGVFLATDSSINSAVHKIRQILRDDPERPRFVQTVSGKGYRFIASIPGAVPSASSAITAEQETGSAENLSGKKISYDPFWKVATLRFWPVLFGISIVLVAALGAYFQWSRSRVRPLPPSGRLMLAVLPFENLTGDPSQDYFSDGMTEELIAQLGNLDPQHLGVIARTSVMQYKHNKESLDKIGHELGVQYALEGSFRSDSGRLRITAQLIQIRDQSPLWARQYDRQPNNLLALQAEIAQEIADEIQGRIGGQERIDPTRRRSPSPTTVEAYELYLKGLYFWNERTVPGLEQAIRYFQQAIDTDPTYGRAYAGTAEAYALMGGYGGSPPTESMPKARAAALRALQLDERLPEAHTALAVIAQTYDWDWQTAEKEYRRAIQLNPNYATGHHWYAECLALQGRFDEAFPEIENARQLDPLSFIIATDYGAIFYFARQYDRAIERLRGVLEMKPDFPRAHMLVWAYTQKGLFADALADAEAWGRHENMPWSWVMIAYVSGRSGDQAKARLALEQVEQLERHGALDPLALAVAYIGTGENDKALVWLEKGYRERSSGLTALKVDPIYDPLRGDPRFRGLLRHIQLAP